MTPLRRLKIKILLPRTSRKSNLIIVDAVNTTCTLTLILITQRYTDFEVRKNLFWALSSFVCHSHCLSLTFLSFFLHTHTHTHTHTSFTFFLIWDQMHTITQYQKKNQHINKEKIVKQKYSRNHHDSASQAFRFDRNLPANKSTRQL